MGKYSTKGAKKKRLSGAGRHKRSYNTAAACAANMSKFQKSRSGNVISEPQPPGLPADVQLPGPSDVQGRMHMNMESVIHNVPLDPHQTISSNTCNEKILPKRPKNLKLNQKRLKKKVNVGLINWRINKRIKAAKLIQERDESGITHQSCTTQIATSVGMDPYNYLDDECSLSTEVDPSVKYVVEEMEVNEQHILVEPGPCDASRDEVIDDISVRFIVDGKHFFREMRKLENHRFTCEKGPNGYFKLISSSTKCFVWNLKFKCPLCGEDRTISSDPAADNPSALNICDSVVWGTMSVGGGHANMEELFATVGVRTIDQKTFAKKENELGQKWQDILFETTIEAGKEEKQLAFEHGDVDENGIPFITVIVDGGWSHRSFGHRYTANSGVACVIGNRTKKLLHVDVRNKYCSMCNFLKKSNKTITHEGCFRNWEGTSQGMESDMLVEAFRKSQEVHGLQYRCVIGDGDASVFSKLRELVPYGLHIEKSECANHATKNYCKALYGQKHLPQAVRKIVNKRVITRLKKDARYAIYHVAETTQNAQELREDLMNGPAHVLGVHDKCKPYFCQNTENESQLTGFRLAAHNFIQECLKPLLRKAHRLVKNDTSNLAESLMSLVAKFSGGKRTNRSKRGSWGHRVKAAGLDFQLGPEWTGQCIKKLTGKSPSSAIKKAAKRKVMRKAQSKKSLIQSYKRRAAEKRAARNVQQETSTEPAALDKPSKGSCDYGPLCYDLDMDPQQYQAVADLFIQNLSVDSARRMDIEKMTRGQSANDLWFAERKCRLTASKFGEICKRHAKTPSAKLVERLVYPKQLSCDALQYGMSNEFNVIAAYKALFPDRVVSECGLFVHSQYGYLAASPDGLVDNHGIVEIKCPYTARDKTFPEALAMKNFFLDKDGLLKKNHDYYFQIQGQLEIVDRQYCDLVV